KDVTVLHSQPPHAAADSAYPKPPAAQKLMLILTNVFIENDHALRDLRAEAWLRSANASPSNCTASAMASRETLTRYCHMIVSQSIPAATCLSTWLTLIRVPRKVGWPWQISGSATM